MKRRRPLSEATKAKIGAANRAVAERKAEAEFWARVQKTETCWLWIGSIRPDGYGQFRSRPAHRFSYALQVGSIAAGMVICHRCDVRNCVRPDHLFQGTQGDNVRDASEKGRLLTGASHPMRRLDVVARVAAAQRGVKCPSRAKFGPKHSLETREKMRLAKLGKPAAWALKRKAAEACISKV